jgi:hypothetical protein
VPAICAEGHPASRLLLLPLATIPIYCIDAEMNSVLSNIYTTNQSDSRTKLPIKRVLVVDYSQSGQLSRITERILGPLRQASEVDVHVETLRLRHPFPFPWDVASFFDAFPESAHLVPPELEPLTLRGDENFDLVIIPYQVWFLAPSQPITAFLKHPAAQAVLKGKPVVTVIACRNMWMMAQEKMKQLLADSEARLMDNVVLIDPSSTLATLVTTPYWLMTGKRQLWGFAPAGIDDGTVKKAERFGAALLDALRSDAHRGGGPLLKGMEACVANPGLLASERAGTRSFYVWGKLLRLAGPPRSFWRKPLLVLYAIFLILLIVTVVPLSLLAQAIMRPFLAKWLAARKLQFEEPSGSGRERMGMYE